MSLSPSSFPLDLTGTSPRNLITNDTYTLTSLEDMMFIPAGGPFYSTSLVIRSGSTTLRPNVDYKCLHLIKEATVASGLDVVAIIEITKENVSTISLDYRVIGGQYAHLVPTIRQLLEGYNGREPGVNWNTQIYGKPDLYPPAPHFVSGEEFSDWGSVVLGIQAIERAILLKDVAAWGSMYQYLENLINNKIGLIDLTSFATKSLVNAEIGRLAPKTTVYTKEESDTRYYTRAQVEARIGDIDGNETYYTEKEVNAKFIEITIADAKFATKAELNRLNTQKADASSVYTRAQVDDKFIDKMSVYTRDWVDANLVIKGVSYLKAEADARFTFKGDAYTRVEADNRFALRSQIPQAPDLSKFIKADYVDGTYLRITVADSTYLRKTTADSVYAKLTDLNVIKTLSDKFNNYYTRQEADNLFATKVYLNNNFLNTTQLNQQYPTRADVASGYSTKNELKVTNDSLVNFINSKSNTTWVNEVFATKDFLAKTFYNRTDSDNRYFDKTYIQNYYVDNDKFNKTVATLATTNTVNATADQIRALFANYYTKADTNSLYYTKQYSDATYASIVAFNDQKTWVNTALNKKADTSWVNANFYNKSDSDSRFASLTDLKTNYFVKQEITNNYVDNNKLASSLNNYLTKTDFTNNWTWLNGELTRYATKDSVYTKTETDNKYLFKSASKIEIRGNASAPGDHGLDLINTNSSAAGSPGLRFFVNSDQSGLIFANNNYSAKTAELAIYLKNFNNGQVINSVTISNLGIWHTAYGWLHEKFMSKGESYTKQETDGAFQRIRSNNLTTYGPNADIHLIKENPNENNSPGIYYLRGNQTVGRTLVVWDGNIGQWGYEVGVPTAQGGTFTNVSRTYASGIWHTRYGMLHDYFRSVSDSYSKAETYGRSETYSRTEVNASFYDKGTTNSTFVNKTDLDNLYKGITASINAKAATTWVSGNFWTRTDSDARYYTKDQVNSSFYNKGQIDSSFATITYTNAQVATKVDKQTYIDYTNWVNNALNTKAGTDWVNANFGTKTDVNSRAKTEWVTGNHYNKGDSDYRYYTKDQINASFATNTSVQALIKDQQTQIDYLKQFIEKYKVGDIYITTKNFINGAAVAEDMKYGVWERYGQGRTLVGISPNGYVDGDTSTDGQVSTRLRKYNPLTMNMGIFYGEHNHMITEQEMPWHKHSANNVFNKFSAKASDVLNRDRANGFGIDPWEVGGTKYNTDRNSTAAWVYYGSDGGGGITTDGADNTNTNDESMINGFTTGGWTAATEEYRGGNAPLAMSQPSIVVGIWRRIA